MPNFRFVVSFYDPFSDERLNPPTSAELYQDPRIPGGLHHTVYQAKALVGVMNQDTFKALAIEVGQLCDRGTIVGIQRWQELTPNRDYRYVDEADRLPRATSFGTTPDR